MVAHRNWGAGRKSLKLLYKLTRQIENIYGIVVYDNAKDAELQKLNIIKQP